MYCLYNVLKLAKVAFCRTHHFYTFYKYKFTIREYMFFEIGKSVKFLQTIAFALIFLTDNNLPPLSLMYKLANLGLDLAQDFKTASHIQRQAKVIARTASKASHFRLH